VESIWRIERSYDTKAGSQLPGDQNENRKKVHLFTLPLNTILPHYGIRLIPAIRGTDFGQVFYVALGLIILPQTSRQHKIQDIHIP
jgi:hypothetical protein